MTHPVHAKPSATDRRQITVLFCDIVNSTVLAGQLDPEDLHELLNGYQMQVGEVVASKLGHVARVVGDGVLAYFGWPSVDEFHADSAVRAALLIIDMLRQQGLAVRIGIATGMVVTGRLADVGPMQSLSAVGQVVHLAARLQAVALPDTVVISATTRTLVEGMFELTDLGPIRFKGFDEPQAAWQADRPLALSSRSEVVHTQASRPMVGRKAEMDALIALWQQARAGHGQIVLVMGEAGIGKSRLLAELESRLSGEPHRALRYFCSQHLRDSALAPIIARWHQDAGFSLGEPANVRLAKIEVALGDGRMHPENVALLASMLSVPTEGRYPELSYTPQRQKELTASMLLERIADYARERPVLLLVEDAHWADPSTLELLQLGFQRLAALPVFAVLSSRGDFRADWVAHPSASTITLDRLDRPTARALAQLTGGRQQLSTMMLEQITDMADGVPLFIEELTKDLLERERAAAGPQVGVPDTLQGSLMARLDRWPRARQVAQTGAVLGRSFSYSLLRDLERPPEPLLAECLSELVGAGLVDLHGTGADANYTFKHALIQEVAYASALRADRRRLHARVAAVLEERYQETLTQQPELMAHHCAEAGAVEKAVDFWLLAAKRAIGRSALLEAANQVAAAVRLLPELSPESRGLRELQVQLITAQVHSLSVGPASDAVEAAMSRARHLWEQLGRPWPLAQAVFYGQWFASLLGGRLEEAASVGAELARLSERRGDDALSAEAAQYQIATSIAQGHFLQADCLCRLWLARAGTPGSRSETAQMSSYRANAVRIHLGRLAAYCGNLREAETCLNLGLQQAEESGNAEVLAWAICNVGAGEWAFRSDPGVQPRIDRLIAIADAHGFVLYRAVADVVQGWTLVHAGQHEAGLPLLRASLPNFNCGTLLFEPFRLILVADGFRMAGDFKRAFAAIESAIATVERTGERWLEADIIRLHGELLVATNKLDHAERRFRTAIDVARRQTARTWELRATLGLSRMLLRQRRLSEAEFLLSPVVSWFEEQPPAPDVAVARDLLVQIRYRSMRHPIL